MVKKPKKFNDFNLFILNGHKNVQLGYRSWAGSIFNWSPGSRSAIQNYGSADPDPFENIYGYGTLLCTHDMLKNGS
jgi:hypothetical protein